MHYESLANPFALRASFGGVVDGLGNNVHSLRFSLDVAALSVGSGCEILREWNSNCRCRLSTVRMVLDTSDAMLLTALYLGDGYTQ